MKLAAIGFVVLLAFPGFAQQDCTRTLKGTILESKSELPVAGAVLTIAGATQEAISQADGQFLYTVPCSDSLRVRISHLAYRDTVLIVNTRENHTLKLLLVPEIHVLNSTLLIGHQSSVRDASHIERLTAHELERVQGSALADQIDQITGVRVLRSGSNISKPVVRGLYGNRVVIVQNGVRLEGQQWGTEHAPEVGSFFTGDVSVIKGPQSLRYGQDAMGGTVVIQPAPIRRSPGVSAEISMLGTSNGRGAGSALRLDLRPAFLPALGIRLQGNGLISGDHRAPGYYLDNTGKREYNGSATLEWSRNQWNVQAYYSLLNTDLGVLSTSHIGNLTDLQQAFETTTFPDTAQFRYLIRRPSQHVEHELVRIGGDIPLQLFGKLSWQYARQYNLRQEFDKHRAYNDSIAALDLPALQLEITTHSGELVWHQGVWRNVTGGIGITGNSRKNTQEGRFFIPNFKAQAWGIFMYEKWHAPNDLWDLDIALRYDQITQTAYMWRDGTLVNPHQDFKGVSGHGAVHMRPGKDVAISLQSGWSWRPPGMNELYSNGLHHGAAAVEYGDSTLNKESVWSSSLRVGYTPSRIRIDMEVYHMQFQSFINLIPGDQPALTIRGAFPTYYYTGVPATLYGLDANIAVPVSKGLDFSLGGSILRGKDRSSGKFLSQMPPDRLRASVNYTQSPSIKWISKWYGSVSCEWVNKAWKVDPLSDFAPPPKAYVLPGMQLGADLLIANQSVAVHVVVTNLLNSTYRSYLNRFRYYADESGTDVQLRIRIPIH
ncbi:MAG: TonB-dependent receptor [Flavobacteriales bacterium]|nr:TonB-dependent receptor [Flavobacteriales bacterium]